MSTAKDDARGSRLFIDVPVFGEADDRKVLDLFDGLRVADVSDGMDRAGLKDVGLVDAAVHALWKDTKTFAHRFIGIAVTARYVPTQQAHVAQMPTNQFNKWMSEWYNKRSSEPFMELLRPGSAMVIEEAQGQDVGSIGSNNIMAWKLAGCVGVVSSGTARDTDEIIMQGIPLYFRGPGRGVRPGRNEIESVNRPVVIGGVLVIPGDVVVADGDGVIVVPRTAAATVAEYAMATLSGDKSERREKYEQLGMPLDSSVQ